MSGLIIAAAALLAIIIVIYQSITIVPQQSSFVVERLGKYSKTLDAGLHLLIPFFDRVAYKFSLKEEVIDTPAQPCITRDNVTVEVDGLVYIQVVAPKQTAYGIANYRLASTQLAQTTLRSAIGRIELDKTFEERELINAQIVEAIDQAATSWGIKVTRYELKDITPPKTVRVAMEAQMTAEREKRAAIAKSEGERQSAINVSEGHKQEAINISEGEKQRRINEAEGQARQIELVSKATADGLNMVAEALATEGGTRAANLRVGEQYVSAFEKLAKESNTLIIPSNMSDISGMIAGAMSTLQKTK